MPSYKGSTQFEDQEAECKMSCIFCSCFRGPKNIDPLQDDNTLTERPDFLRIAPHKILSFPAGVLNFPVHSQSSSSMATMEPKEEDLVRPLSAPLDGSAKDSSTSLDVSMQQLNFQPETAATSSTPMWKSNSERNVEFRSGSASNQHPSLQFTLYHDIQHRSLTVQLQRAYNLPPKGHSHTCNPFVCVFMLPNKEEVFTSKLVEKNFNPIFDESFHFSRVSTDEFSEHTIVFRVFDHVKFLRNEFIGSLAVPLRGVDVLGDTVVKTIDESFCQDHAYGADILFSLEYDDHDMRLQGVVHRATNLDKHDVLGQADPYVNIHLLYKGKRKKIWKTITQKNTLEPVFNESFQFDISQLDIQDISLEFELMDYNRFIHDDVVGVVQVGSHAALERGRTHWQQILDSPQQVVSMWHPVMPPSESKKCVQ